MLGYTLLYMAHARFGKHWLSLHAFTRLCIAILFGLIAAYAIGQHVSWLYAPLTFWDVTAIIAASALWLSIRSMDAQETQLHATKDDPGHATTVAILITASFASLAGVLVLVVRAHTASGLQEALDVIIGIGSVIASWALIHLLHTLRYADLYFDGNGAVDFHGTEAPTYQDFAYMAFTVGMTYQVSDTNLKTREIRQAARKHAIISYVFGTAIIAMVINTLSSLGGL